MIPCTFSLTIHIKDGSANNYKVVVEKALTWMEQKKVVEEWKRQEDFRVVDQV
jgi:hypothetical protein